MTHTSVRDKRYEDSMHHVMSIATFYVTSSSDYRNCMLTLGTIYKECF